MASVAVLLLMKYRVKLEWRMAKGKPFDWKGCLAYAAAMICLTFGASELASAPALAGPGVTTRATAGVGTTGTGAGTAAGGGTGGSYWL